jgi:hypothetical protein
MEGPEKLAEYSFIGFKPVSMIRSKNTTVTVLETSTGEENVFENSDPLQVL